MDTTLRGAAFEKDVARVLDALREQHPAHVEVVHHPRLTLYDGQQVIPDFDLRIDLPFAVLCYAIECQDRDRSEPTLVHKVKYVKSLSARNAFLFVYRSSIPPTTLAALEADGVACLSFDAFTIFTQLIAETLAAATTVRRSEASGFARRLRTRFHRGMLRYRLRRDKPTIQCDLSPLATLSQSDRRNIQTLGRALLMEVPELFFASVIRR